MLYIIFLSCSEKAIICSMLMASGRIVGLRPAASAALITADFSAPMVADTELQSVLRRC